MLYHVRRGKMGSVMFDLLEIWPGTSPSAQWMVDVDGWSQDTSGLFAGPARSWAVLLSLALNNLPRLGARLVLTRRRQRRRLVERGKLRLHRHYHHHYHHHHQHHHQYCHHHHHNDHYHHYHYHLLLKLYVNLYLVFAMWCVIHLFTRYITYNYTIINCLSLISLILSR